MKYLLNGLMVYGSIVYLTVLSALVYLSGINFINPTVTIAAIWVVGLIAFGYTEYFFNKRHILE